MSVPFSNTHLRVPQGFGTLLEGLAREVLRDQPEDIPKYAAQYFDTLLKQREESDMDPAEWAAKLEDRFYNNHAFKTTQPGPEKDTTADVTSSKKTSYESQSEDDLNHSAEASNVSPTKINISEEVNSTESTEEEEKHIVSLERKLSEGESVNRFPGADVQLDDLSGTEEERDPIISKLDQVDRESNENESNSLADQDIPQSELEATDVVSFSGVSNVDVCAQELGMAEDAEGHKPDMTVDDEEILHSEEEETTEAEEPVEVFPYSGLANVDVCATELGAAERKMDGTTTTVENDAHAVDEESLRLQPEETLVQSSLSQFEREDQAKITKPEEGTENETFSEDIHEGLAHVEGSLHSIDAAKDDSLVEIIFEDEVTAVATGQIISDTQGDGHKMEGTEMDVYSEGEEMESHHEAFEIIKRKVDRNESNLNHSDDDEEEEGVKNISSSHQPTIESDEEDSENETDHENEDKKKISEGELHQDQNQDFEKEANYYNSDIGEDTKDNHTEGYSDAENISSQVIQSSISAVPIETESETFVGSEQHLPEDNDESQRKPAESQSEDTMEEKEVTSKEEEELFGEGIADPEIQEKSDAVREEKSISLTHGEDGTVADHQEEQRPHGCEKDTTEPESKSNDKQEDCSRPQEEEDIMDIPLDDPEANRAAAKIQAGFRGHMTRKKMKPEDKAEGEEVSSTGDVLNGSQGDPETGGSGAIERDDTSVPEQ